MMMTVRPQPSRGLQTVESLSDDERVAALLHDRSLTDQRELVDAVAATASLAFEKERLQAELRAQYLFLQTIINTAPSLLSVVDTEGRIRNFNRAVEVASGIDDRNQIEGRYFWEIFIDPGEREEMIQRFRDAWTAAGHDREPRVSVSRSIFPIVSDRDRAYFGSSRNDEDQVGYLDGDNARFGKTYAAEPDQLIEQLAGDEAIAAADTLLITIPNQLGVDYNAALLESLVTHVAPGLGWR